MTTRRAHVLKFGGAALRDGAGLRRVAAIVAASPAPRAVVVSALEGVTDRLARGLAEAPRGEAAVRRLLGELGGRHRALLAAVAPADAGARSALDATLERLERVLYGIAYTEEATPRLHDLVLSFGERLSAPVAAAALRAGGVAAEALDAERARVASLGPFGNARPDIPRLRTRCRPALQGLLRRGITPVVTGYFGVDRHGHTTLFGRGGSDYVAALVAFALDAQVLELWKDVPGFLTADPRAVPSARRVPELGYDEAAELANFGANVLHPRTVEPVEGRRIPIRVRSVRDPGAPGTVVRSGAGPAPSLVRSVAAMHGLAVLRLNGPGMSSTPGIGAAVFDALGARRINVLNMAASQASFALLLEERDVPAAKEALAGLVGGAVQSIDARSGRSLVCVVGAGLGETPGSAARILAAVAKAGVNVEMISLGASDIAIDLVTRSRDAPAALRSVHAAFLEGRA